MQAMAASRTFISPPLAHVHFGPGSLASLVSELAIRDVHRAVIVTGRSIAANRHLMGRLYAALGDRVAAVFSDSQAHAPRSTVLAAAASARSRRADGLISFGGGSRNDTMKGMAWALAENLLEAAEFDRFAARFETDHADLPSLTREPLPNFAARGRCQTAAWLSFCNAANVDLGLSHGIGLFLGARIPVAHGETSCAMLHNVMEFNREATLDRQAWLARILNVSVPGDERASALAAAARIRDLVRDDLALPWRLRDLPVSKAQLPFIAAAVMQSRLVVTNPRPIASEAEILDLLERAW